MPVYIDPTRGTNGAGTLADPRNTWAGVTWTAGESYLQRAGTQFDGRITVGASGTSESRITLGVYDPATGEQIVGVVGAAIVRANGDGTAPAINAAQNFVAIIGFDAQNAGGTQNLIRNGSNDGAIVEWCRASNGGGNGITLFQANGTVGVAARYNEANNNRDGNNGNGITLEGTPSAGWNNVDISGNTCNANGANGIWLLAYDNARVWNSGAIVGNVCRDNITSTGVRLLCEAAAGTLIAYNVCEGNRYGIFVQPYSTGARQTRVTIYGNRCNANKEFGIHMNRAQNWTVEGNEASRNGENLTPFYGRGIELYGESGALCSGRVLFNVCEGNLNFGGVSNNGSEGCGIGVDDFCADVEVRGNLCRGNEGNGIQCNPAGAGGTVTITHNLLIGNYAVDATRAAQSGWVASSHLKSQISLSNTQNNMIVRNNTIIYCGASTCWYGISENTAAAGTGTDIRNNVVTGAAVAALKVRDGITRTHNALSGAPVLVQAHNSTTTLGNGTGAVTAAPLLSAEGRPLPGSPLLTGGADLGYLRDIERKQSRRHIGAYGAARLRSI